MVGRTPPSLAQLARKRVIDRIYFNTGSIFHLGFWDTYFKKLRNDETFADLGLPAEIKLMLYEQGQFIRPWIPHREVGFRLTLVKIGASA